MSGGGKQTTNTVAEPWRGVQPMLQGGANAAQDLFQSGGFRVNPYEGNRVAGFGDLTQQGMGMIAGQAGQPTFSGMAGAGLQDMMSGNVYSRLDDVRSEALGRAIPAATAMFSGSGRTDSGAAMDTVGRAATQAIAPIDYSAFLNTQQNQLRSAALAPGLDQASFLPGQMMMGVGGMQDAMAQERINADMARFYEGQNVETDALNRYSQLLMGYGGMGGATSSTAPGASTGSRIAGAGMTGLGAYGAMAGMGMGGPVGAGLAGALTLASLF
jgi:hypothetical protein